MTASHSFNVRELLRKLMLCGVMTASHFFNPGGAHAHFIVRDFFRSGGAWLLTGTEPSQLSGAAVRLLGSG